MAQAADPVGTLQWALLEQERDRLQIENRTLIQELEGTRAAQAACESGNPSGQSQADLVARLAVREQQIEALQARLRTIQDRMVDSGPDSALRIERDELQDKASRLEAQLAEQDRQLAGLQQARESAAEAAREARAAETAVQQQLARLEEELERARSQSSASSATQASPGIAEQELARLRSERDGLAEQVVVAAGEKAVLAREYENARRAWEAAEQQRAGERDQLLARLTVSEQSNEALAAQLASESAAGSSAAEEVAQARRADAAALEELTSRLAQLEGESQRREALSAALATEVESLGAQASSLKQQLSSEQAQRIAAETGRDQMVGVLDVREAEWRGLREQLLERDQQLAQLTREAELARQLAAEAETGAVQWTAERDVLHRQIATLESQLAARSAAAPVKDGQDLSPAPLLADRRAEAPDVPPLSSAAVETTASARVDPLPGQLLRTRRVARLFLAASPDSDSVMTLSAGVTVKVLDRDQAAPSAGWVGVQLPSSGISGFLPVDSLEAANRS